MTILVLMLTNIPDANEDNKTNRGRTLGSRGNFDSSCSRSNTRSRAEKLRQYSRKPFVHSHSSH